MLRILLLHELLNQANPLGIAGPAHSLLMGTVRGYIGSSIADVTNNGLTKACMFSFFLETRRFHFWILSASGTPEMILRLFQYVALETTMLSFGYLANGGVGMVYGGFRSVASENLKQYIINNSTRVLRALEIEEQVKNAAIACSAAGKRQTLRFYRMFRELGGGYQVPQIAEPISRVVKDHRYRMEFAARGKEIMDNIVVEQMYRRYTSAYVSTTSVSIVSRRITRKATEEFLLTFGSWQIVGIAGAGLLTISLLVVFQTAERRRYSNLPQHDSNSIH